MRPMKITTSGEGFTLSWTCGRDEPAWYISHQFIVEIEEGPNKGSQICSKVARDRIEEVWEAPQFARKVGGAFMTEEQYCTIRSLSEEFAEYQKLEIHILTPDDSNFVLIGTIESDRLNQMWAYTPSLNTLVLREVGPTSQRDWLFRGVSQVTIDEPCLTDGSLMIEGNHFSFRGDQGRIDFDAHHGRIVVVAGDFTAPPSYDFEKWVPVRS